MIDIQTITQKNMLNVNVNFIKHEHYYVHIFFNLCILSPG